MNKMRKTIFGLMFLALYFPFLMENSLARESQENCNREYNYRMEQCFQDYNRAVYDIWGHWIGESNTTYVNRKKCYNSCLARFNDCTERVATQEREEQKTQEEQEKQAQGTQEDTATEYHSTPSNNPMFIWTDKNEVTHITNKTESSPPKYQEQNEQEASEKETQTIEDKNNTKPESTDSSYSQGEPKGKITTTSGIIPRVMDELGKIPLPSSIAGIPTLYIITLIAGVIIGLRIIITERKR